MVTELDEMKKKKGKLTFLLLLLLLLLLLGWATDVGRSLLLHLLAQTIDSTRLDSCKKIETSKRSAPRVATSPGIEEEEEEERGYPPIPLLVSKWVALLVRPRFSQSETKGDKIHISLLLLLLLLLLLNLKRSSEQSRLLRTLRRRRRRRILSQTTTTTKISDQKEKYKIKCEKKKKRDFSFLFVFVAGGTRRPPATTRVCVVSNAMNKYIK